MGIELVAALAADAEARSPGATITATPGRANSTEMTSFLVGSSITLAMWIVVAVSVHEQPAIQQLMIVLLAIIATALLFALLHESDRRSQRDPTV